MSPRMRCQSFETFTWLCGNASIIAICKLHTHNGEWSASKHDSFCVRARFVLRPQTMRKKFLMKLKHKRFSHEKLCLAYFYCYCWLLWSTQHQHRVVWHAVPVPVVAPQSTTRTHTVIISYDKLFFALAHARTHQTVFHLCFICFLCANQINSEERVWATPNKIQRIKLRPSKR